DINIDVNELSTYKAACYYASLGLSVIPILPAYKCKDPNKGKEPALKSWKEFQERLPTEEELKGWFDELEESDYGIGMICGEVSGGLEVLDVEVKLGLERFQDFQQIVREADSDLWSKLLCVRTPNGGFHYLYYCSVIESGQKLALSEDKETLIETRGEGNYVIPPGSPVSVHPAKRPYVLGRGSYDAIPTITQEEREILLDCARIFNKYVPLKKFKQCLNPAVKGTKPGDIYNNNPNIRNIAAALLQKHGAKISSNGRVTRLGGNRPSATLFDSGVLYVFSTNYKPFEPDTAYAPFYQHVLLESNGDSSRSGQQLYNDGYRQPTKEIDLSKLKLKPDQSIQTTNDVFTAIIKNLPQQINYKVEAGRKEGDKPLSMREYAVITAEKIVSIAEALGFSFRYDGNLYVFNSQYWLQTSINKENFDSLISFVSKSLERLGQWFVLDRFHTFKDHVCKQFISTVSEKMFEDKRNDSVLVNFLNGTLEIRDGKYWLREFDPEDFLTYQLSFDYDPDATCPKWEKFLDEVLPSCNRHTAKEAEEVCFKDHDRSLQKVLSEYFGSCFTSLNIEKALFNYGSGANGKSVVFNVIIALFGRNNISHCSLESLGKYSSYVALLHNKLLNFASEGSRYIDSELFKKLVSKEPVEVDRKYENPFTMTNYARLAFNANEMPQNKEYLEAFQRRFIIIPFNVKIPDAKADSNLANKIIKNELPGIMNWVLQGLDRLLSQGKLTESSLVKNEVKKFMSEGDIVLQWLKDEGWNKDDSLKPNKGCVQLKDLHLDYTKWCEEYMQRKVLGRDQLKRRLAEMHDIKPIEYRNRQYYQLKKLDIKERSVLEKQIDDEFEWE
ncbi:MAG: phage/plasmid primase, P4 family, partial [Nitrososphaerales archaeon]